MTLPDAPHSLLSAAQKLGPGDWIETHVSNYENTAQVRVYRKASGDLILTLDANTVDRSRGPWPLEDFLAIEWASFMYATRHRFG